MSRTYLALASLLAIAALACSSGNPLSPDATGAAGHPAAGAAGMTTGNAGTTGEAGMGEAGVGVAGTTGDAGAADAAAGASGTAGTTGAAGTKDAAAGTSGTAGTGIDAPIEAPSSFDALARPDASSDGATLADGRCIRGAFSRNGGPCTCQADIPIACGASCIDPTTDDDNCGVCGNKCGPTSTCQRGTCGPPPVTIVPSAAGCQAIGVAVSGNNLFWTDKGHSTVSSMPVTGGTITTLSSVASAPTTIVATGLTAFWLESGARAIRRSTLGGPVLPVVTSATDITNFTVAEDGNSVFFSTGTTVMKVLAVGGGAAVPVVSEDHGGMPGALALQGGAFIAYPTAVNGDVDIAKLTPGVITSCGKINPATDELLPNPSCNRVARSQGSLVQEFILIRDNRVFWADGANVKANDMFSGVQANDNVAQTLSVILGMAATASTLYFGDAGEGFDSFTGVVYKSPTAKESVALRIARAQNSPRSFAVDATRVYWSTGDCTIRATGL